MKRMDGITDTIYKAKQGKAKQELELKLNISDYRKLLPFLSIFFYY